MRKDARNVHTHTSSLVATAMALYSASTDGGDAVACFFVRHDMGEWPSLTKWALKDRLERRNVPQSESQ